MKYLSFILLAFFLLKNLSACNFFSNDLDNNYQSMMGKKSKIYDAYKQGKCVLDNVLEPLTEDQRKVIAKLIAKSYIIEN